MKKLLRKIIPAPIKKKIRLLIKFFKYNYRKHALQNALKTQGDLKIIVGAAETFQPGWYSTNEQWLDITKDSDWDAMFKGKPCLTHVVAEHVFEHLTYEEAGRALANIRRYLKDGGRVRIAVPDGYNPDPVYLKHVGINGIGDDAADHKQLLNVDTLSALLRDAGFKPAHIEGYAASGEGLVQNIYSAQDGFIMRSRSNTDEEKMKKWSFPDAETSLIVDGIKTAQEDNVKKAA